MLEIHTMLWLAALAIILLVAVDFVSYRRRRMRLPPGPIGYPIIGNLFDMPNSYDPLFWAKCRDLYGPSIHRTNNTDELW